MCKSYVFSRYWPNFTRDFPFDRFNDLAEEELEAQLRAVVEREGPSDEAVYEWLADCRRKSLAGTPELGVPVPSGTGAMEREPTPKLQEWIKKRDKRCMTMEPAGEPMEEKRDDVLLIHKLRWLGWLSAPTLWDWSFLKRRIVVVAPTREMAAHVANALNGRQSLTSIARYGCVVANDIPVWRQLLFDQEADQRRNEAMKEQYAGNFVVRCALDLLDRLAPTSTKSDSAKDGDAAAGASPVDGNTVISLIADQAGVQPRLFWLKMHLDSNPNATLREIEIAAQQAGHKLPRTSINRILLRQKWINHPPRVKVKKTTVMNPNVIAESMSREKTRQSF